MTFGIIGLGIMGGSIAKALRTSAAPDDKILALDKNNESLNAALTAGIVDRVFTQSETKELLAEVDMLFVCLYPAATLEFFREHKGEQQFCKRSQRRIGRIHRRYSDNRTKQYLQLYLYDLRI